MQKTKKLSRMKILDTKTKSMHQNNHTMHQPVLLNEVIEYLKPEPGQTYLDLTAGYGGHALSVRAHTNGWTATLVDRDQLAIDHLQERFTDPNVEILHQDFLTASQELAEQGRHYDMILADLGVSSPHLNIANRGFAINQNGPLDMRMDQRQTISAETLVNELGVEELTSILKEYGEEPKARRIAQAIVAARPIQTTQELAEIVAGQWRGKSRVHPATRTFQALRIAVNDELRLLEKAIPLWVQLLKPGGRLAIISFHSLEDRIVKQLLAHYAGNRYDAELTLLTKRPITATTHEVISNPRARSAKLRVAVKIKTKGRGL